MDKKRGNASAQFVPGYQDIIWLAGRIFTDRQFMDRVEQDGFEAIYAQCPYGDLSDDQKKTFRDTFDRWEMRLLVRIWWVVYDHLRRHGKIAAASEPWRP